MIVFEMIFLLLSQLTVCQFSIGHCTGACWNEARPIASWLTWFCLCQSLDNKALYLRFITDRVTANCESG